MISSRRLTLTPTEATRKSSRTRKSLFTSTPQNAIKKTIATPKTPLVLLKETTSPKTPEQRTLSALDPVMEKIKRDLNSPSAAARLRGTRALKSPGFRKANYQIFDVAHEEQDIITDEERQPFKQKTIREVFADCRIFVEVRTGDDNRSSGIKSKLLADGITVNEKLYKDTTHVIFKEGLLSNYKLAKKMNIPVTTILWIETCKAQRRLVDPSKFQISNLDRYEHPELYPRMRRQKSSQPEISKQVSYHHAKTTTAVEKSPKANSTITSPTSPEGLTPINSDKKAAASRTINSTEAMIMSFTKNFDLDELPPKLITKTPMARRRVTTFTPNQMDETNHDDLRRYALRTVEFYDYLHPKRVERMKATENITTPPGSSDKQEKSLFFNSANRIGKSTRRSIMDVSMNIFEMNCKELEKQNKEKELAKEDQLQVIESSSSNDTDKIVTTQIMKPTLVRKRKLFSEALDETISECKENVHEAKHAKLNISLKETPKPRTVEKTVRKPASAKVDRRKTISFFKTDKPATAVKPKTVSKKYVVCTNMSSADKQVINAAILKLGGHVENEVSEKTTHIITPTIERTMNLLRGIIRACYIVNVDWIHASNKEGKFLDTTMYQHGICNTQKIFERSVLGKRFKNNTFAVHGPFYIQKETIDNERKVSYVKEIIEQCGGVLTSNRIDAKIIISDRPIMVTLVRKPTVLISTFIFDAAMQGRMISTAKYTPKNN